MAPDDGAGEGGDGGEVAVTAAAMGAAVGSSGGDSGDPDALLGSWRRDEAFEVDEFVADVVWTGEADGVCSVELISDELREIFVCEYTVDGDAFTITDDECDGVTGRYTFAISGDALSFTLVDDPCEDRQRGNRGDLDPRIGRFCSDSTDPCDASSGPRTATQARAWRLDRGPR